MAEYKAKVTWGRGDANFIDNRYSRAHYWEFDGGVTVKASSSPHVVPLPLSDENAVDPEEAFIASLASCHMLWFLSIAAKRGFVIEKYVDNATGTLGKNGENKLAMTSVVLHPQITIAGEKQPTHEEIQAMHTEAHEKCFIASSVKSEVRCEPIFT